MQTNIMDAPHGMNLVVECSDGSIVIGRFDSSNGFEVIMHDVDLYDPTSGSDSEAWVRETATYGVDVKHRDWNIDVQVINNWTPLGQIEKLT
ncbi:MAG: hypothetical protein CMJ86_11015 [Planctomycetes bacterium]|nr:hypothetical protein [Planctomycetota bacterium]